MATSIETNSSAVTCHLAADRCPLASMSVMPCALVSSNAAKRSASCGPTRSVTMATPARPTPPNSPAQQHRAPTPGPAEQAEADDERGEVDAQLDQARAAGQPPDA